MRNLSKKPRDAIINVLQYLKSNSNDEYKEAILDIKNQFLSEKYGLICEV